MTTDPRNPQPYPENSPENNPDLVAKPHDLGDDGEIYLGAFQDAEPDLSPETRSQQWEGRFETLPDLPNRRQRLHEPEHIGGLGTQYGYDEYTTPKGSSLGAAGASHPVGPEDFGGSDYLDEAPAPYTPDKQDDLREYLQKPHPINAEKPHPLNRLMPATCLVSAADPPNRPADPQRHRQKPQPKPAPQPAVAPRHPNPLPGITPWQESEAVKNRLYTLVEIDAMLEEVESRIELAEKEFDRLCEAVPFVRRRSGKVDHRFQGAIHKMKDLRLHFLDLSERVKKFDA